MTSTILIVDDEPANLALLRQILGEHYPLVFARNGPEALSAAQKHQPSLVLLDIEMPGMSGYEVCRCLKNEVSTASIPVIFVTSLSEVGNETAGFDAGAVDYIVKPVSPPVVRARVRTHLSLVSTTQLAQSYNDAIYMLGEASEFKDTDTGTHIWRMAAYSRALADAVGWSAPACTQLEMAAPMHDIGKLAIPDNILHKPGKLDTAEWAIMQTHSEVGYRILSKSSAPLLRMAATIARHHHERWDGSGYPAGLAGNDIPEMARIVAIADVFDALSMPRPYKDAWPMERVVQTLRETSGSHFEPRLVASFLDILPRIVTIGQEWRESHIDAKSDEAFG
jgi:putative two-component system response regulator